MPRGVKAADKHQKLVRLTTDQIARLEAKLEIDNISYQKLSELLIRSYLKGNKEIMRMVKAYVDQKGSKRKNSLNELEKDELYRVLEDRYSPMKDLEEAMGELENEK
jgi:hypothetical protein